MLTSHALTSLLKRLQWVPKRTLWRECKVPPSLPPSHKLGLNLTASARAASSPTALMDLLGTFCNFLSPCLCSWYFLQLESRFSSTLPTMACILPSFEAQFKHHILQLAFQKPPGSVLTLWDPDFYQGPKHKLPNMAGLQMSHLPCCNASSLRGTGGTLLLFIGIPPLQRSVVYKIF